MTAVRRVWSLSLACLLATAATALPVDLTGEAGAPTVAWRLDGVSPGATVVGCEVDGQPLLLVSGPRVGDAAAPLGDLCLASERGWGVRRIVARAGLQGLPALLRRVALAGDLAGVLHVWPLGTGDRDTAPWKVEARGPIRVGPLVVGSSFVFAAGATIYSVSDLVEPRWQQAVPDEPTTPLASDGDAVFVAAGNQLVALDAAGGTKRWQVPLGAAAQTGLLVTAGLVVAGLADGTLRAYDAGAGDEVWRRAVTKAALAPQLALGGPWLFAADAGGGLTAVDAATGEPQWQATVPLAAGSPTIGFGRVFIIAGDGRLYAVPLDPAQPRWSWAPVGDGAAGRLVGAGSLLGGRVYVTSAEGSLFALDLPGRRGPVAWAVPGGTAARNGRVVPAGDD